MRYLRFIIFSFLLTAVNLGFAQETNKPDWRQLHYLSQEEMEAGFGNRLTNFTATAAPTGTVRFPGEFEPMQAVLVRYPLGLPVSFIKTLAEECKVITLVSSGNLSAARNAYNNASVNMDNCEFVTITTDSYWVRDYCPWFIFNNNEPAIVDFRYNRPRENDDIAPVTLAENYFNIPWYGMDVTHTGGNMMEDGRGFGISDILVVNESTSTESGYSGITEAQIYERMEAYLGIDNYLVTDDPQGQYIAHVDCWGKLLAPDKVLVARMPTTDSRYSNYEEIAEYFENTNCCWGYPYQVFRVDEISSTTSTSTSYLAPYTNSLILNDRVFVPLGSNTTYNNNALQVYRDAMPGYTIIGVASNSSYPWYNTDALHCRTRGVMDFDMLFVDHRNVVHGEQPKQESFEITSTFIAYSGQALLEDQLLVYYRFNGGEWQTATMTATGRSNEYTGYITGYDYGDTVEYYVSASDASGRTTTQPVMGAADPHSFKIEDAPVTYAINATANPTGYGTVTGAGVYDEGANVVLTATPVGANVFVNWTENGEVVSTDATYSFTAAMDRDIVANFESSLYWTAVDSEFDNNMPLTAIIQIDGVEQYTNTLEVGVFCGDECRASAIGELFSFNGHYILSLLPFGTSGEEFSFRLYDHSTGTELTPELIAPANVAFSEDGYGTPVSPYVLNFTTAIHEYTVTVTANPTNGGTVAGGGTFEQGSEVTVTATANEGYTFFNWSLDGNTASTNAEYTFTVDAEKELVANFNLNTYTITVNTNPSEGGSVEGAGTYSHGETVTLTATANENFRFIGWMENNEVISSETTYSFTAEANRNIVAKFSSTLYWTAGPGTSEDNMTISAIIQIDGVEQFTNTLEVGVFVGDECRASAIGVLPPFTNHYILSLLVFGDANEEFSFRLYDHTTETELTPELTAPSPISYNTNGYGSPVNPYVLNFTTVASTIDHDFTLAAGWNWWSTYIEMNGVNGLALLEDELGSNGLQIKNQNNFVTYDEGWFGSLNSIDNEMSYHINVSEAGDYTLTGTLADPDSHPIDINTGWNWIGYIENSEMAVNDALDNLVKSDDDILKSFSDGFSSYYDGYGWWGNLTTLRPGLGYMYNAQAEGTLTYPSAAKGNDSFHNASLDTHWTPVRAKFEGNMSVIATVELDGVELRSDNIEVDAFCLGECRGAAKLMYVEPIDRYVAFLTVYGEDHDAITLQLYDNGQVNDIHEQLTMTTDGVIGSGHQPFALTAKGSTAIPETLRNVRLFPNPSQKGQEVRIELPAEMNGAEVEIIDMMGRTVYRSQFNGNTITTPAVAGVYTLRVTDQQGNTRYGKLIVQ